MTTKLLRIEVDGSIPGLIVVGFHGHVDGEETPAKLAPVFADASGCIAQIVEVGPTRWTPDKHVRVESFPPALRSDEPLPGEGTRIGSQWAAQHGNVIMAIGPEERRRLGELQRCAFERGGPSVFLFIQWFAGSSVRDSSNQCERQGEIGLWYCTEHNGFSLLVCANRVVKAALFAAVREKSAAKIEDTAWWLSRAAIDDQDIYLAGAALRRVASPAWEVLIHEGLHLPNRKQWKAGLEKAEWHLRNPPPIPDEDDRDISEVVVRVKQKAGRERRSA